MSGKYIDTTQISNEEFWRDLGIDIEKHDELMKVLPVVYQDVYLTQKNRPKSITYFDDFISDIHGARPKEVFERKKQGDKVIGAFCAYFPEELVLAANAVPLILCGGADFPVADAEKILPRNTCPLIKSSFGFRTSKICPYFLSADLLVGETTCGGKKKMYELLNEYTPTYTIHLPHKKDEEARKLWLNEVKIFKNKTEEITGNKITYDKLKDAIAKVNKKREILQKLYNTRKANPSPISGKDVLLIMQLAFFDDVDRFVQKTGELVNELEGRIRRGEGVVPKDTPRILISGTPMTVPNWKLHHIIEASGAIVVGEESCTGTRYFSQLVEADSGSVNRQLKKLAERYLHINCACFTPNIERPEDVVRLAKEYKADGVVYYVLQFCHEFNVEFTKVERALKEEGIPVIKIETDYSQSDIGQLKTRLETFIEILKSSKADSKTIPGGKPPASVKVPLGAEIA